MKSIVINLRLFIVAILFLAANLSLHANNMSASSKDGDPWPFLLKSLADAGFDTTDATVLTVVPAFYVSVAGPVLVKEFGVKQNVQLSSPCTLGDVICGYMCVKYGKKHKEKFDYLRVRYSSNTDSLSVFLTMYPESQHSDEIKLKLDCIREYTAWTTLVTSSHAMDVYDSYSGKPQCNYEGYALLSRKNMDFRSAVSEWKKLVDNGVTECSEWDNYIDKYGDWSPFKQAALDSSALCKKHKMWTRAKELNTIASYQDYIDVYPKGRNALEAKRRIEDMKAWNKVVESRTYKSYSEYYSNFPDGDSAEVAKAWLKKREELAWARTRKVNDLNAYSLFLKNYPEGYYSNEARNRYNELIWNLYGNATKGSITDLKEVSYYSQDGYSYISFANVGISESIAVNMIGTTAVREIIPAGKYVWVKVKNGDYKIFVTSSNGAKWNGHGNVSVSNKIYCAAWFAYTIKPDNVNIHPELFYVDRAAEKRWNDNLFEVAASELKIILQQSYE